MRCDELDTTPRANSDAEDPLPVGIAYPVTKISNSDTNFAPWKGAYISHAEIAFATFDNSNHEMPALWEAGAFEPMFGALLSFAVGDLESLSSSVAARPNRLIDSFAGINLDTNKLERVASGHDDRWSIRTERQTLDGQPMTVLRLKGRMLSLAHGVEVAFFAYASNATNIHRIELTAMPLVKTPYVSIRSDFDTNGFPHTWIVETPKEEVTKKTVRFKEIEIEATFDERKVFLPDVPKSYQVRGRAKF